MNILKVCFIGVGSIAKRHIRNLEKIADKHGIKLTIEALRRDINIQEERELNIQKSYKDYMELPRDYDVIFITNPTEFHIDTLKSMAGYGRNFFIEKPISSIKQIKTAEKMKLKQDSIYYVACPLRFNAVIQYIKESIPFEKIVAVRSISSSYLPEWRPGTDYRNTYSAYRELGGGVSIDLIHEWDYLTYLFGFPQKVCYISGKKSKLEISSEDSAVYIAEYFDKIMELHLDYYGRKAIRNIMIFTDLDTIVGDIANNRVIFLKSGKIIDFNETRNDYQIRELEHFLDIISGNAENDSDIKHAIQVLKLTQGDI